MATKYYYSVLWFPFSRYANRMPGKKLTQNGARYVTCIRTITRGGADETYIDDTDLFVYIGFLVRLFIWKKEFDTAFRPGSPVGIPSWELQRPRVIPSNLVYAMP